MLKSAASYHSNQRGFRFGRGMLRLLVLGVTGACLDCANAAEATPPGLVLAGDFENTASFEDGKARPLEAAALPTGAGVREFVPGVEGSALKIYGSNSVAIPANVLKSSAGTLLFWLKRTPASTGGHPVGILSPLIQFTPEDLICQANFGKGATCALPYSQHSEDAWHHLALTWQEGGEIAFYLDGKIQGQNAVRRAPEKLEWDSNQLVFTCGPSHNQNQIVIDKLRGFDRALTAGEIAGIVRADAPLELDFENLAPARRVVVGPAGGEVAVTFPAKSLSPVSETIHLETLDASQKVIWEEKIELASGGKSQDLKWVVPVGRDGGPARLKATLEREKGGPVWALDIMRLADGAGGEQAPSGSRTLIKRIDCTAEPGKDFLSQDATKVVESPLGKYRETGSEAQTWFAYRFDVKNPGVAHILSFTYPDNASRTMAFDIADGSGSPPSGAGVETGGDGREAQRISNTMRTREVVFWPATKDCAVFVLNWSRGKSAAASSIEIYQMDDGNLPKTEIQAPLAKQEQRFFGTYVEDASMSAHWGGKDGRAKQLDRWKTASENLASFFRHTGQNVYYYPICWYTSPLFPNKTEAPYAYLDGVRRFHPDGAYDILLQTLNRYGVKLMPTLDVKWLPSLGQRSNQQLPYVEGSSPEQVYAGMRQVLRNGKVRSCFINPVLAGGFQIGPMFNPLHPKVQDSILGLVDDWLEQYGSYPAMAGLGLDLSIAWGGSPGGESMGFERLDSDYSDFTVGKFSKETGIKVPGGTDSPDRYEERHRFLTSPEMKEKWIAWRCERIRDELVLPIARKVWDRRPDFEVSLFFGKKGDLGPAELGKNPDWKGALRECGFDLDMYSNLPRTRIILSGLTYPESGMAEVALPVLQGGHAGVIGYWADYREQFRRNIYSPANEIWPEIKANACPVRVITEKDMFMLRNGINALAQADLMTILVGGMGQNAWQGHQPEVSNFARAFRSLPAEKFEDIPGLEDPVRVRQLKQGSQTYVYLLNTEPYPITVDLDLTGSEAIAVLDLVSGQKLSLKKGVSPFTVPPYQLTSWKLDNGTVAGGQARVPAEELDVLKAEFAKLPRNLETNPTIAKLDQSIQNALERSNPALARGLLAIAPTANKIAAVKEMNWLLIGPFDSEGGLKSKAGIEAGLLAIPPTLKGKNEDRRSWREVPVVSSHIEYYGKILGGFVDTNLHFVPPTTVYAITNLTSDSDRDVDVHVGWDDLAIMWLNGEQVLDGDRPCPGLIPREKTLSVRLKKGDNFFVVKVLNAGGPGGFCLMPSKGEDEWPKGVQSELPRLPRKELSSHD